MKRHRIFDDQWAKESPNGEWVDYDDAAELQRQLEAMTKERDHYKRLVELSDALRNAERGYGINPLFNANQGE